MRASVLGLILVAACVGAPDREYYEDGSGGDPEAKFTIGGLVTSLKGSGLVLTNAGADDLAIAQDGPFVFARKAKAGAAYDVAIKTQPTNPSQACQIAGGKGTVKDGSVSNVYVACGTDRFAVGGTVTGLKSGQSVVLQDNGADDLTIDKDGTFTFPAVLSGLPYDVTIKTGPTTEQCEVSRGKGVVGNGPVTNVTVACGDKLYAIGGTAAGIAATGLSVTDSVSGETVPILASGNFVLPTKHFSGTPYDLSLVGAVAEEICSIENAQGSVADADVTSIAVTCEYRESFDTSASWPTGWTATGDWQIVTNSSDSAPNHAFTTDPSNAQDKSLTSKPYAIVGADARLTFRHSYTTEATWDGGVLEIALNGGSFQDILTAGGTFTTGGYDAKINPGYMNALDNRNAWTGSTSGTYKTTVVTLPANAAGQSVSLRWRFGTGKSMSSTGWSVDSIALRP